jgi:ABC-type proline/glycine betaine transport system permease subunit
LQTLKRSGNKATATQAKAWRMTMSFWHFLKQNWPELLDLTRQHVVLVLIAIAIAIAIGVPTEFS